MSAKIEIIISVIILSLIIIPAILGIKEGSKKRKENVKKAERQREEFSKKMQDLNAIEHGNFKHVAGLSISENTDCDVFYCKDDIVIESSGLSYNLPHDRVTDICIKTETEIHSSYVSSIGGAIGGAVLFGPIGAVIGGRVKEKKKKENKKILIFTYTKDNNVQYLGFYCEGITSEQKASKFVKIFKQGNNKEKVSIEL